MSSLIKPLRNRFTLILGFLFIIAVALRFLYFPDNIYFGYDQARDAFISQELLHGEIKIIGPTTSIPGLNHGALFYYIFAPIYLASQSDPSGLSIFLRIYNALGIVLIFFIGKYLFNKWVGLTGALLFAFSYEQTQYALFMTHPALAVLSVLTFYLGLTLLLFKNRVFGLPIALLGLGLSFQFHFLLAYLGLIFVFCMGIFWRRIPKLDIKVISLSAFTFLLTVSTFILAEIKFGFSGISTFINSFSQYSQNSGESSSGGINGALLAASRYMHDNIFAVPNTQVALLLVFLIISIYYLAQKEYRDKIIFLLIWFIVGLFSYFISDTSLYFYGVGTSISLLVFAAFLTEKIFLKYKILAIALVLVIISSNLYLIITNNRNGPNPEINVQRGMLLHSEKAVMDYIYSKAGDEPFAVNAFSMPLYVNTTWAYLFEWYGKEKYDRLPIWGGNTASGYPGNLTVNNSRTTLPEKRFLILEPVRGIEHQMKDFLINEGWFTDTIEERQFGEFYVYFQKPK